MYKLLSTYTSIYLFFVMNGLLVHSTKGAVNLPATFRPCQDNAFETCTSIQDIDNGYKMKSDIIFFKTSKSADAIFTVLKSINTDFYKILAQDLDKGFFYEDKEINPLEIVSYSQSLDSKNQVIGVFDHSRNITEYYSQGVIPATKNYYKHLIISLQGNKNMGNAIWYQSSESFLFNFNNQIYDYSLKNKQLTELFKAASSSYELLPIIINAKSQIIFVNLLKDKTFQTLVYDKDPLNNNQLSYRKVSNDIFSFLDYSVRGNKLWTYKELQKQRSYNSIKTKFGIDISGLNKKIIQIEILNLDTQEIEGQKYVIWENDESNEFLYFSVSFSQDYFAILQKNSIKIWKIEKDSSYLFNEIQINALDCVNLTFLEDDSLFCQNYELDKIRYFTKGVGLSLDRIPYFQSYTIIGLTMVIIVLQIGLLLWRCIRKNRKKKRLDKLYYMEQSNHVQESYMMKSSSISLNITGIKESFLTVNSVNSEYNNNFDSHELNFGNNSAKFIVANKSTKQISTTKTKH